MSLTADTVDFNRLAQDYERLGEPMSRPFAVRMLDLAEIRPGERIIDVAAGPGALAVAAAERGAHVLATDIAAAMVHRAAERLRPFEGCEAREMSLDALDAADGEFDAAFSNIGVLVMSVWRKGLSELTRVTRPGGAVGVAMWTEEKDVTPARLLKRVFERCFPDRVLWPEGFFPTWSIDSLAAAMREAGCTDVVIEARSGEWRPATSSGAPIRVADGFDECDIGFRNFPSYAALTKAERERLRTPMTEAFAAYAAPDGTVRTPTEAFVAVGRKQA